MSNPAPSAKERLMPEVTFGIAVMRGISALGIGLLLIFYPEKSLPILGNTMGFFWLFTGLALLRRSKDDSLVKMLGNRTSTIVAIVGILTGLLVVTRSLTRQVVPGGAFIVLLGVVIMLTGVMHITADIRVGGAVRIQHRWLNLLLGVFEVALGFTLVISPWDRSPATYWIATIWALVFGVLVIGDAFTQRSQARKTAKEVSPEGDVSTG